VTTPTDFLDQDPTVLVNPYEEFLAGDTSTPDTEPHDPGLDLGKIALVLAAAFIVYRVMMKNQLASAPTPRSEGEARKLALSAWKAVAPFWLRATVPAITRAYQLGSTENVSYAEMEKLATDYALSLGEYVNQTSVDSLVEGYQGGLSQGWNESLAWIRASEGFGLERRQMRAYVQTVKGDGYDPIGIAAKKTVDAGIMTRAENIGENEAFAATQMGKVIVWMSMMVDGTLPAGTKKKWVTANDERVCGVCGPLDQDQVGIHQHFTTVDGQKYYAPGVHPNCRCQIELAYPEVVIKAMGKDPYDRDPQGQFAPRESRKPKLRLREKEADPMLEELFHRAAEAAKVAPKTNLFDAPSASLFDAPAAANLFADVGREDLFLTDAQLANTEAFARADLYTSVFKNAKRRIVHHVIVNGVRTADDVPATPVGDWGFYEEPVYFSGDDFSAHWTNVPRVGESKPWGQRPDFKVGSLLSVDFLSRWDKATNAPKITSIQAWSPAEDDHLSKDKPTAAEAALLESLRAGLELERIAQGVRTANRTAAEANLDAHTEPGDLDLPQVIGNQDAETLSRIVNNAAVRGDGYVRGDTEWQSLLNSLPSDERAKHEMLMDFIMEGYYEGDQDLIDAIEDEANPSFGIGEDETEGLISEAEATIDPNWTPTVIQATGFYGTWLDGHMASGNRLIEGSYQVIDTQKGYIPRERLDFLLGEWLTSQERNALLETSPLMERGEYRIVVVKPTSAPSYPVSLEEYEHKGDQAEFTRMFGGK
jgi:hypothetical protein